MRRRSLGVALTVAALAFGLSAPQTTNSASAQSLEQQRDQVRAERARVAAQIDTSKASLNEIDDALQLIEENLRTQEAALSRIEGEVAQAESDIKSAEAAIVRLDKEIGILRDEMRRRAVAAYVSPASDDVLSVLQTNDFTTAATRKFYIELRSQGDADVSDRLEGATDDIGHQRELAKEAREIASLPAVPAAAPAPTPQNQPNSPGAWPGAPLGLHRAEQRLRPSGTPAGRGGRWDRAGARPSRFRPGGQRCGSFCCCLPANGRLNRSCASRC